MRAKHQKMYEMFSEDERAEELTARNKEVCTLEDVKLAKKAEKMLNRQKQMAAHNRAREATVKEILKAKPLALEN